jgi:hypothetical protein
MRTLAVDQKAINMEENKKAARNLCISLAVTIAFVYAFASIESIYPTLFIIGYFSCLTLTLQLSKRFPKIKCLGSLHTGLSYFFKGIYWGIQRSLPIFAFTAYLTCFCWVTISVPLLLLGVNKCFALINTLPEIDLDIRLTLSSIIATSGYSTVMNMAKKCSIFILSSPEMIEKYNVEDTAKYIITLENIRFCIYVAYFIFTVYFSLKSLGDGVAFELTMRDQSIMYSFLSYLAYDQVITNRRGQVFSFVEFMKKITRVH